MNPLEEKNSEQTQWLSQRVALLEGIRKANLNLLDDLEQEREKISVAKAKDEAILASIGDGLVATDRDGKITLVNGAFEKILGWNESEVRGKLLTEIIQVTDESGREVPISERLITKALKREIAVVTTTTSIKFRRRGGTFFPVALTTSPIKIGEDLIGAVEVFRDITKEKEFEQAKNEFISIASHQLRTPLTGIQWVVERFTKKEQLTPKGKEYLEDIHMSAKRLTEMVDLLLDLSRVEAGRVEIKPEPLEIIGFIKNFLGETAPLQDKKELKVVFEDHPAELAVMTDKSALHNIVQSLISNAIEYTKTGGRIDIAVQKKKDTFVIKVTDTGIGIPKAEQARIFEKFARATNAKLYKTDGTGIGLYITERATSRLGGKIWFESVEGKGSTFYVELSLEFKPVEQL